MDQPNRKQSIIQDTEQHILNNSFDPEFGILSFQMLGQSGTDLKRLQTDANGNLKADPELLAALGGGKYTTRLDEGVTYVYVGKAVPGTLNSSPSWQIIRYTADFSEGIYADGNDSFDNIWDNRSSLSYA